MDKIGFIVNHLGFRGTEIAVYDYMKGCRDILKKSPFLFYPIDGDMSCFEKFSEEFPGKMISYSELSDLEISVKKEQMDVVYWIKAGFRDDNLIPGVKNIVHAVFDINHPHGDVYAHVSSWLAKRNKTLFVPHIVSLPDHDTNFREFLGLPKDALVFGRYGGYDQFDVEYLSSVIKNVIYKNANTYFLLMNTKSLGFTHPNVIYLEATFDLDSKRAFLNTIDCFLHGRTDGESFGLAVCEALFCNKPVISNIECRDRHHIELMKDKGFYYSSAVELEVILSNFNRPDFNYRSLVEQFSEEKVMEQFNNVFLK